MDTYSFDLNSFSRAFEKVYKNTSAIIIQHTYGLKPKNYIKIKSIASKFKIPIIEDKCHCNFVNDILNQSDLDKSIDFAHCYSFENGKPIKLGRGGMLIFNSNNKSQNLRLIKLFNNSKKFSTISSLYHFLISIIYSFFLDTKFYWFLLENYRKLSKKNILPSNHNLSLGELKIRKMVFPQSLIINSILFSLENIDSSKSNFIQYIKKYLLVRFLSLFKSKQRYSLYVEDKFKALKFCQQNGITVSSFFDSAIQPLNEENYKVVNYNVNKCKNAELASKHVITFEKKPTQKLINKLKNS